jgi:hypothetical protein
LEILRLMPIDHILSTAKCLNMIENNWYRKMSPMVIIINKHPAIIMFLIVITLITNKRLVAISKHIIDEGMYL